MKRCSRAVATLGPLPSLNFRFAGSAAATGHPGRAQHLGEAVFASRRLPCAARARGPVAQLAALTAFAALEQARRVSSRSALRARPRALRSSAAHSRPGTAPPSGLQTVLVRGTSRTQAVARKAAGGAQAGRMGAAEKHRVPGRARSALRAHACGRLFERRERSERSELGHRPGTRASQGTRSAAQGKPSEPRLRPARRLACADAGSRQRTPANAHSGSRTDVRHAGESPMLRLALGAVEHLT